MGVSLLSTGPGSGLVLLLRAAGQVGKGRGGRPGGRYAHGTIERAWAGVVSWLCPTAPTSCLSPCEMLEGRSDAFGNTCSGIRPRFYMSQNPELPVWDDVLLTEIAKPADRKPAEAAGATTLTCAAFPANPSWRPGVARSPCVPPRAGAGSDSVDFPEPSAGSGPQPVHNT